MSTGKKPEAIKDKPKHPKSSNMKEIRLEIRLVR